MRSERQPCESEMRVCNDLPHVDEHQISIAVPRDQAWTALDRYVTTLIGFSSGSPLARILGTTPRSGFEIVAAAPNHRITLAGRHRFSRYALVFELRDAASNTTVLRAKTYAVFPGLHGRLYRAMVVGTRLHALATRQMLRAIQRLSASA